MAINQIQLENVIPEVFVSGIAPRQQSEVWSRGLTFEKGKRYLVSAASGAGKTSLCAYLCGIRSDYQGEILFDGKDIRTLSQAEWSVVRQSSIAWLPQDTRLFPTLTAVENVMLKASLTKYRNEIEVRRMLAELGLQPFADRPAKLLSAGQQQRVAAVRSLCQPFSFLLLDEPVSHLDETANRALSEIIDIEASRQGAGIITTSVGNDLLLETDSILYL